MNKVIEFFRARNNVTFYVTAVSQIIMILQAVFTALGYGNVINEAVKHNAVTVVEAIFTILSVFGFFKDHRNPTPVARQLTQPINVTVQAPPITVETKPPEGDTSAPQPNQYG